MGSTSSPEYWGYLINADKSPSILFEQLLLGIANYIVRAQLHVAPWDVGSLTPTKLAAFYRLVGGDYDPLFLETPDASLSFIYQSLGCFHVLQQEKSPYTPPSIPALTPQGFVRWQTVQVLLEPNEHVAFLQNAVKRLEIINPADGLTFPHLLPRDALPSRPDPEMVQWHQGVGQKLMGEAHAIDYPAVPLAPHPEIDSSTTTSSIASSLNDQSLIDTARYFTHPRPRPPFRPPPSISLPQAIGAPVAGNATVPPPWQLERRRSSTSDIHSVPSKTWPHDHPGLASFSDHENPRDLPPRSPSTVSTSTVSSSSSDLTASSASVSPRLELRRHQHQDRNQITEQQHSDPRERRHSTHVPLSPRAASHPRDVPAQPPTVGFFPPPQPARPAGSNSRGLNVRWEDSSAASTTTRRPLSNQDQRLLPTSGEPKRETDGGYGRSRRARSGSEGRSASPLRGVGGRKYAPG